MKYQGYATPDRKVIKFGKNSKYILVKPDELRGSAADGYGADAYGTE